jgi:hypothetical protein
MGEQTASPKSTKANDVKPQHVEEGKSSTNVARLGVHESIFSEKPADLV